eukprot:3308213-Pleurochrysis_carterae.AAC.2
MPRARAHVSPTRASAHAHAQARAPAHARAHTHARTRTRAHAPSRHARTGAAARLLLRSCFVTVAGSAHAGGSPLSGATSVCVKSLGW